MLDVEPSGLMTETRPTSFPPISFRFFYQPTQENVKNAIVAVRKPEIRPPNKVTEIYQYLHSLEKPDWHNLDSDPVLAANIRLPMSVLWSLYQIRDTRNWATLILSNTRMFLPEQKNY